MNHYSINLYTSFNISILKPPHNRLSEPLIKVSLGPYAQLYIPLLIVCAPPSYTPPAAHTVSLPAGMANSSMSCSGWQSNRLYVEKVQSTSGSAEI